MIKVNIIGYGKMGKIRAEAIEKIDCAKINKIYDITPNIQNNDYYSEDNIDNVIKDKDVDAIFICTPNFLNKKLTIKSLKASKHVFCEKPPAFNSSELEEVISIEKQKKLKLMYGFNHRHHESIHKMYEIIKSKEYGKVIWMRGRYGKSVDKSFFKTWRAKRKLAGGGILLDQGIHMLDLFIMMGGGFDSVKADVSNHYWKLDIEDNVFAIYKNTKTGIVASLHSTMTQWRHLFSLEIFLEKGYLVLNGLKTSSGTYGEEILSIAKNRSEPPVAMWQDEETIKYDIDNSWSSEVKHFFNSINFNTNIEIGSSKHALEVMKLIDKTYRRGSENG